MIFGLVFLLMFFVPAGVLGWRIVVTKSRTRWVRIWAAAAVMMTLVGACVVSDDIVSFSFRTWRDPVALLAALAASFYLVFWSLRRHANRRHRTISLIAALIGAVPAFAALAGLLVSVD